MATFLANEINTADSERDIMGPKLHVQIMFPQNKKMQGIRRCFFFDVDE